MTYTYAEQVSNVHLIDTHMFGFDRFQSCYLIKGREMALVDTGVPTSIDFVRRGLAGAGVAVEDIEHIFVTHCEHPDHSGNAGVILKKNPRAKLYINPAGLEYMTRPEIESARRKAVLPPQMAARFGEMVPVPQERIVQLRDGDVVDLGEGRTVRAFFTPGHQPSGMVLHDEKNQGIFINDLVGMYLADADFTFVLTPKRSDVRQYMASLNRIKDIPVKTLFLGHFGISREPRKVIERALDRMQTLMDIGTACIKQQRPEEIVHRVREMMVPELEKVRKVRGEELYLYMKNELVPSCSEAFSSYVRGLEIK